MPLGNDSFTIVRTTIPPWTDSSPPPHGLSCRTPGFLAELSLLFHLYTSPPGTACPFPPPTPPLSLTLTIYMYVCICICICIYHARTPCMHLLLVHAGHPRELAVDEDAGPERGWK